MRVWRVLPWNPSVPAAAAGGALWVPRALQGTGRHDSPDHYGCVYLSEGAMPAVAETLAPFRATGDLGPELLIRSGRRLALAELNLDEHASLLDLDDPAALSDEALRPSMVATHRREVTQHDALRLFRSHPDAAGLRWWSTIEASWIHVTLFDRGLDALVVHDVRTLSVDDDAVAEAAAFLGLV